MAAKNDGIPKLRRHKGTSQGYARRESRHGFALGNREQPADRL